MSGKIEFIQVINFINTTRIELPINIKTQLKDLTKKWRNENNVTDDFFSMKENHAHITGYIYGIGNERLLELWNKYLDVAITYRLKRMQYDCEICMEKI